MLIGQRTITSKEFRVPNPNKPAPWPYKERGYKSYHKYIDRTLKRIDENSRIIVVEGNIGSGKSTVARELAELLDFHYIPAVSMDDIFIDSYGVDRRKFYHLLPDPCRMFDARLFYENPRHRNVASFQLMMFTCKMEAYLNALAHLMNTGQGVVVERVVHSDFVFVEAMYAKGILSQDFHDYYYKVRKTMLDPISLHPHLVIYLNRSVRKCLESIQRRNISWENNGKVIDYSYLETIEDGYRNYLKQADDESVIMVYDWDEPGETGLIVEDVEKVDLNTYDWHKNNKFEGWYNIPSGLWWSHYRYMFTDKMEIMCLLNKVPPWDVPELLIHPDDYGQMQWVYENVICGKYSPGYSTSKGDSIWKILFDKGTHPQTNANWFDYYMRDTWCGGYHGLYYPVVVQPNIPEEEFKPKEFVMRDCKVIEG
uniref:NADH dehydrogenase [ubiquinone] 1 alpha subcomplex subunit 10, mitochondrial n=1 Tax=Trichuris muris TaxID=70415 RepID=A0A5S6QP66_TRIMR